jgi:hypothetical protein
MICQHWRIVGFELVLVGLAEGLRSLAMSQSSVKVKEPRRWEMHQERRSSHSQDSLFQVWMAVLRGEFQGLHQAYKNSTGDSNTCSFHIGCKLKEAISQCQRSQKIITEKMEFKFVAAEVYY